MCCKCLTCLREWFWQTEGFKLINIASQADGLVPVLSMLNEYETVLERLGWGRRSAQSRKQEGHLCVVVPGYHLHFQRFPGERGTWIPLPCLLKWQPKKDECQPWSTHYPQFYDLPTMSFPQDSLLHLQTACSTAQPHENRLADCKVSGCRASFRVNLAPAAELVKNICPANLPCGFRVLFDFLILSV